jgi:hypothetical protein
MGFFTLAIWLTLHPPIRLPITDQQFVDWSERCEDAGGHPVQDSHDGGWDCFDDDQDGDEPVVLDL